MTKPCHTELLRLWQETWEALEGCRVLELELADAGLLVLPLTRKKVRLSYQGLAIIARLRRMAAEELLEQKAAIEQSTGQAPSHENDGKDRPDPMMMSQGLFLHALDALERYHGVANLMADKGLSTHALVPGLVQLARLMVAISAEERRNDAQAFFLQRVSGCEGHPPAPLSDAAKQALNKILQQVSPKYRRVLRQLLDRARPVETPSSPEGS